MKQNFVWKIQTDKIEEILLIPPEGTLGTVAALVLKAICGPEVNQKTSHVDGSDKGHGSTS